MPYNWNMDRASNKSSNVFNLGLVLSAFYLNLTLNSANGSDYYQVGPAIMPGSIPIATTGIWPESLGRFGTNYGYSRYLNDAGTDLNGYQNRGGYYDDLLSNKNTYDYGKTYGGEYDYGRGNVVGGGYRELDGRNRGHQTAGFSTSYRKDESGDKKTYYDDGIGHHGKIKYGSHDTRFKDLGGSSRKGGYYDSNLNRNALSNTGKYGDSLGFHGYNTQGRGYNTGQRGYDSYGGYGGYGGLGGYGRYRSFRAARVLETQVTPSLKQTSLYLIPVSEKIYIDATVSPTQS